MLCHCAQSHATNCAEPCRAEPAAAVPPRLIGGGGAVPVRAGPAPHSPRASQPGRAGVSFPPQLGAGPGWGCSCSRHGAGRGPARRPSVRACAAAGGRALGLHAARRARARRAPHRLQGRRGRHGPAWAPRHPPARGLQPEERRHTGRGGVGAAGSSGRGVWCPGAAGRGRPLAPTIPATLRLEPRGRVRARGAEGQPGPGGRKKFLWHIRWAGVGGGPHVSLTSFPVPSRGP